MIFYNRKIVIYFLLVLIVVACSAESSDKDNIQNKLYSYIEGKDATIGIAVITSSDTIEVNGNKSFPMMSVYKFPIAMAVAEKCRHGRIRFSDTITVNPSELHKDTFSPMLEKYGDRTTPFTVSIKELLIYSLQLSDNNASDILLNWIGGTKVAHDYIRSIGIDGVDIKYTEAELHDNIELSYSNTTTPLAMTSLINLFDKQFNDTLSLELKYIMEHCETGKDRLAAPVIKAGGIIGHKTGTGFTFPDGHLMALNDAGYIHLTDSDTYSISVFISDAGYIDRECATIIANISDIIINNH